MNGPLPTGPLPHSALLRLTGWATPTESGVQVGRLHVRTRWRPEGPSQRVSVIAWPRTRANGRLTEVHAPPRLFRAARGPNTESFSVTGQIIRVDRSLGELRVKVSPARGTPPFMLSLHATSAVLDTLPPEAFAVQVTGRVLHLAGAALLAEQARVVQAPVPERWAGHRGTRGYGHHIQQALSSD
ncbi:hypothetical protein [Deinococcus wulumuqiensis]|uniref:hypothetical protein n=1 Tax=Deinococcus wulumuqiensis TaxID=980427 RepID=UPI00242B107B|nr:hypothetical protein [Deinococcus wulumuqiensis]